MLSSTNHFKHLSKLFLFHIIILFVTVALVPQPVFAKLVTQTLDARHFAENQDLGIISVLPLRDGPVLEGSFVFVVQENCTHVYSWQFSTQSREDLLSLSCLVPTISGAINSRILKTGFFWKNDSSIEYLTLSEAGKLSLWNVTELLSENLMAQKLQPTIDEIFVDMSCGQYSCLLLEAHGTAYLLRHDFELLKYSLDGVVQVSMQGDMGLLLLRNGSLFTIQHDLNAQIVGGLSFANKDVLLHSPFVFSRSENLAWILRDWTSPQIVTMNLGDFSKNISGIESAASFAGENLSTVILTKDRSHLLVVGAVHSLGVRNASIEQPYVLPLDANGIDGKVLAFVDRVDHQFVGLFANNASRVLVLSDVHLLRQDPLLVLQQVASSGVSLLFSLPSLLIACLVLLLIAIKLLVIACSCARKKPRNACGCCGIPLLLAAIAVAIALYAIQHCVQMIALDDLVHEEGSLFKCNMPASSILSAVIPVYISGFVATLALSMTCILGPNSSVRKALSIFGSSVVVLSCVFDVLYSVAVLFVFLDEPRLSRLDAQDWAVLSVGATRGILFLVGSVLLVIALPTSFAINSAKEVKSKKPSTGKRDNSLERQVLFAKTRYTTHQYQSI